MYLNCLTYKNFETRFFCINVLRQDSEIDGILVAKTSFLKNIDKTRDERCLRFLNTHHNMYTITCINETGNKTYSIENSTQVPTLEQYRQILKTELESESNESWLQKLEPAYLQQILQQLMEEDPDQLEEGKLL